MLGWLYTRPFSRLFSTEWSFKIDYQVTLWLPIVLWIKLLSLLNLAPEEFPIPPVSIPALQSSCALISFWIQSYSVIFSLLLMSVGESSLFLAISAFTWIMPDLPKVSARWDFHLESPFWSLPKAVLCTPVAYDSFSVIIHITLSLVLDWRCCGR